MTEKVISWLTLQKRKIFYRKGYCTYNKRDIKYNDCTECMISDWMKERCPHWQRYA